MNRRLSFYKYQMAILRKTAEPLQIGKELEDESTIMLYPWDDFCMITWEATDDMAKEFHPHQIVQALRLTKPAHSRNFQYIPTLFGFHQIDDRLVLRVSSEKYSLRKMLANRGTMASRGARLVQQLILMYAEFKRAKVTARTLAPESIYVDERCEQLTPTDLTALAYHHEPVLYFPEVKLPYNNQKLGVNWMTRLDSPDWDLWSVGVICLEIIVGSELVLLLKTYEDVEVLLADIRAFVPMATHNLLREMLLLVRDTNAIINAKADQIESVYRIEEAINGMKVARRGNGILKKRLDHFQEHVVHHAAYLEETHGWTEHLEADM